MPIDFALLCIKLYGHLPQTSSFGSECRPFSLQDDCQNYIRVLAKITPDKLLICGSNAYKPLCRHYKLRNGDYVVDKEFEGRGLCPYDPDHNSTAVYSDGQLYTATVADFSGGDPLIYREPLRTERSDLKQLNGGFPSLLTGCPIGEFFFFNDVA